MHPRKWPCLPNEKQIKSQSKGKGDSKTKGKYLREKGMGTHVRGIDVMVRISLIYSLKLLFKAVNEGLNSVNVYRLRMIFWEWNIRK